MKPVTKIQENVLIQLSRFRFLTLSLLLKLDVGTKQYKYLWKLVSRLLNSRRPLVDRVQYQNIDRVHRVEDFYFLSRYGVEYLIGEGHLKENILYPKNKPLSAKDYFHRKLTIEFQLQVAKWAEEKSYTVPLFVRYFDKATKSKESLSRIPIKGNKYIIPDAMFRITNESSDRIFALEVHNGKNSKRILDQVIQHIEAMLGLELHKVMNYALNRAYYILILFTEESTLKSFLNRVEKEKERFKNIHEFILCKCLEEFGESPLEENWMTILSENRTLKI